MISQFRYYIVQTLIDYIQTIMIRKIIAKPTKTTDNKTASLEHFNVYIFDIKKLWFSKMYLLEKGKPLYVTVNYLRKQANSLKRSDRNSCA